MQHCWHDLSVKFPPGPTHTINAPTGEGRVCCYCGESRSEPLPAVPPRRRHGPYVDDSTEWYVVDQADCPGMGLVQLNRETVIVDVEAMLSASTPGEELTPLLLRSANTTPNGAAGIHPIDGNGSI